MATALPSRDEEVNIAAAAAIRADKEWEAAQGFTRGWVAHIYHMNVAAAAALAVWATGVRWITSRTAFALGAASVVIVILWTGPLSWIHHQLLLWPLFAWLWMVRRERGMTAVLVMCWLLLNGTGELFLGRAGFTWAAQARIPILAFPLLLGAVAWYRTPLMSAIADATGGAASRGEDQ